MSKSEDKKATSSSYRAILEAAILEYAAHGRDGVRLEKVAQRAGVNKALVYRHFKNRDRLFEASMEQVFGERFELLEGWPAELADVFEIWTTRFANDETFLQMLLREALERDGEKPFHFEMRQKYYRQQIQFVREKSVRWRVKTGQ